MLEAIGIKKTFLSGGLETQVLKGIDFKVEGGEFLAIMGRSGAGKSTLMYIMSLLDRASEGRLIVDGSDIGGMSESESVNYRLSNFGFVFQDYALLPELTAQENVALPLLMRGDGKTKAFLTAAAALEQVGLGAKASSFPSRLSGGEQQRVSIARAIAHEPKIIFADEPTANLDTERSCDIMDIFVRLNQAGQTIIMVTHERDYAESTHRIVEMRDGLIVGDQKIANPGSAVCRRYVRPSVDEQRMI